MVTTSIVSIISIYFILPCFFKVAPLTEAHDTDSDPDVYGQRREPSQESLPTQNRAGYPDSSTPTYQDYPVRDAYPAWSSDRQIPLSKEEIEDVFLDLTYKFGFQRDS